MPEGLGSEEMEKQKAEGGADHEASVEVAESAPSFERLLEVTPAALKLVVDRHCRIKHVLHPTLLLHDLCREEAHQPRNLASVRNAQVSA